MSLSQCWVSAAGMLTVNLKLDLVCLMPPTHACAERALSSCLLPVMVLFQDSAVVPGLIDTIDTVMSHISYNLQASKPQVAIVGSSSMAGSLAVWVWVRMAVRQAGAGGRGGAGNATCLLHPCILVCTEVHTDLTCHPWRCTSSLSYTMLPECAVTFWRKTELGWNTRAQLGCSHRTTGAFETDLGARFISGDNRLSAGQEMSSRSPWSVCGSQVS